MPTKRQNRGMMRKTMKGGFVDSKKMWSFMGCKNLIDALGGGPPGVKKNWAECLTWLANKVKMSPENLFNKMTPHEFLFKAGVSSHTIIYNDYERRWGHVKVQRDQALKEGKKWGSDWRLILEPLPGKPMTQEQRKAAETAREEAEEKRRKEEWIKTRSNYAGENWFEERKKQLEEGASIVLSEECEERMGNSADPEMCLAARKGKAIRNTRNAKREAALKANAYKKAINANVAERWGPETQGALMSLAAQKATTNSNFRAVYNGAPTVQSKITYTPFSGGK